MCQRTGQDDSADWTPVRKKRRLVPLRHARCPGQARVRDHSSERLVVLVVSVRPRLETQRACNMCDRLWTEIVVDNPRYARIFRFFESLDSSQVLLFLHDKGI